MIRFLIFSAVGLFFVACSHNTDTVALHTPAGYAAPQDMTVVAAAMEPANDAVPAEPAERVLTAHHRHHRRHHHRHHHRGHRKHRRW